MAYVRNKPRRKFYKKFYKKYGKYPMGRRLVNKQSKYTDSGMPESLFVKLKYVARQTLSGAPSSYFYSGNDINQCDVSSGGGQPYNSDQLCALYTKWCVTSSKIKVRILNNTQGGTFLVRPTLVTTAISDLPLECSRPDAKCVDVVTRGRSVINHFETTKNALGIPNATGDTSYDGTSNSGGPSGSPPVRWFWALTSIGSDNLTTDMDIQVEITYYVKCFRRSIQPTST